VCGHRTAEIKRMYVVEAARGRGFGREMLGHLERTAIAAGADAMILETGRRQPEAIALYKSAGYAEVPRFGHYAHEPAAVHLGRLLAVRA
jgi:ribosomal protein S18 acetylase RimI-like enzyme